MGTEARPASWGAAMAHGWLIAGVLIVSGCERKIELQWVSDVGKASEIAAALGARGIEVDRRSEKSGVMLSVAGSELPRAMQAMREAGLMRPTRSTIDEALGKRGIAPTPHEALARRIHAIERELEATIMDIDGVVAARVRIVPPERPAPGLPLTAASASVFIKHRADVDLSPLVPGIASLVKNGAPGLAGVDDRRVAVLLVPEHPLVHVPAASGGGDVDHATSKLVAFAVASMTLGYGVDRLVRRVRRRRAQRGVEGGIERGGSDSSAN